MDCVLITGGTSGIGLALAKRYLADGAKVIIVGRSAEKLGNTLRENPGLIPILSDVSREEDRTALFETVVRDYPDVNILINNAGIQQRLDLMDMDWEVWNKEIETNFAAPVHLCGLFAPFLKDKKDPLIVNVSSGLGFRPFPHVPVYCATKAGLHAFTYALREQMGRHGIKVIEIIPPSVNTNLGGPGVHSQATDVDEFTDSVYAELRQGREEIGYGFTSRFVGRTKAQMESMRGGSR
ncbi:MAG: SDR family NAD(P)-dependent oxidoreductase [Eubacteriaceae bacterium]|nr:SDR family NAD(P)-dependent oxidoreductase [Eubacteriaceae bacterium]